MAGLGVNPGPVFRDVLPPVVHDDASDTPSLPPISPSQSLADLESHVRSSTSIDEFTRIITEYRLTSRAGHWRGGSSSSESAFRSDRDRGGRFVGSGRGKVAIWMVDEATGCICCEKEDCQVGREVKEEWAGLEADLRLSAEIGQALLRKVDVLERKGEDDRESFVLQRDQLMSRLTASIKERSLLGRGLTQANLNLEAAESSNRAILRELDDVRGQVARLITSQARSVGLEGRGERLAQQVEDLEQELEVQRKRVTEAERRERGVKDKCEELQGTLARLRWEKEQVVIAAGKVDEEVMEKAKERIRNFAQPVTGTQHVSPEIVELLESLVADNESLQASKAEMESLLTSTREELKTLRDGASELLLSAAARAETSFENQTTPTLSEELFPRSLPKAWVDSPLGSRVSSPTPSSGPLASSSTPARSVQRTVETPVTAAPPPPSSHSASSDRESREPHPETRTATLPVLLDYCSKLFARLASADPPTIEKRLQRQRLAGDVGHLARVTIKGLLNDIDGLRDHFRKVLESERSSLAKDGSSLGSAGLDAAAGAVGNESLVSRKDFISLVKLFRDVFAEMARLRGVVNEVGLHPSSAEKILEDFTRGGTGQLAPKDADKASGWMAPLSRLLGSTAGQQPKGPESGNVQQRSSMAGKAAPSLSTAPSFEKSFSAPQRPGIKAAPAAMSSTVAVEIKSGAARSSSSSSADGRPGSGVGTGQDLSAVPFSSASPPSVRRSTLTRAQSRNLHGLFAGAATGAPRGLKGGIPDQWEIIENDVAGGTPRLRTTRSGTDRPRGRPFSTVDDAALGGVGNEGDEDDQDGDGTGDFRTTLLERTLLPRGLSDSSIRSTFLAHGHASPLNRVVTPATLALSSPSNGTAAAGASAAGSFAGASGRTPAPSANEGVFGGISARIRGLPFAGLGVGIGGGGGSVTGSASPSAPASPDRDRHFHPPSGGPGKNIYGLPVGPVPLGRAKSVSNRGTSARNAAAGPSSSNQGDDGSRSMSTSQGNRDGGGGRLWNVVGGLASAALPDQGGKIGKGSRKGEGMDGKFF